MDGTTGRWLGPVQRFDTWLARNTGTEMNRLVDHLEALPDGTIVLVAVADEAGLNVDLSCSLLPYPWVERGLQAFEALGSTQIRSACFRSSWSLIAIKGERSQDGTPKARAEALSRTGEALSWAAVELR